MTTSLAIAGRATPVDAAAPSPIGPPNQGDPAGFALLLRQTQAAAPSHPAAPFAPDTTAAVTAADADPQPSGQAEATPEDEAPRGEPAAPRARMPAAKARGATGARADKAAADAAGAATATAATPADAERDTNHANAPASAGAGLDPSVLHWLAAQQRAAQDKANAASAASETKDTAGADAAAIDTSVDATAAVRGGDTRTEPHGRAGAARELLFAAGAERAAAGAADRVIDGKAVATAAVAASAKDPAGAALPPGFAPVPTAARDAAPAVTVALTTAPNAPEFPRALGVQISVFARDGVQHAELHLNPADMGPVSVQIAMDGSRAHVEFGADQLATRQIIEAGMPELASALRDAGFTLAGGGVSQHPGGGSRGGGGDAERRAGRIAPTANGAASPAASAAVSRRVVSAGGVDLYA